MNNPASIVAEIAATQIGVHETSDNQGPGIEKFWLATSYPDGMTDREPWCSAFASWCVKQASEKQPILGMPHLPNFPAVAEWIPWAMRDDVGGGVFKPRDSMLFPRAGDIVIYNFSHVGIVENFSGHLLTTIEGNTNDDGSREGREVLRKDRELSIVKAFVRLPLKALPV